MSLQINDPGFEAGTAEGCEFLTAAFPMRAAPEVKGFFDPRTNSIQNVVSDPATKDSAIVDPVLDFDETSGATGTKNADAILSYVHQKGLAVRWILDTHPHADHLTAAY